MAIFRNKDLRDIVEKSSFRKQDADLRLKYFHDQQSERLFQEFNQKWRNAEDFTLFHVNVVRKIIKNKSMTYKMAPFREFGGSQDVVEQVYGDMGANKVLKKASRYTKLMKTCLLQPRWMNDRMTLNVITPNIIDVIYSDPHFPDVVIITNAAAKSTDTTYSVWTNDAYELYDFNGNLMINPDNPDNVNPYGVLPFVPTFDSEPDDQFFVWGGEDIIDAQTAINIQLANLWRNIEYQAHGQPVVTGLGKNDAFFSMTNAGPNSAIKLPEGATFDFKQPNAPIEDVLKSIEFVIKQTALANDLSPSIFDIDPVAESGVAKLMESQDLIESRQDDLDLWRTYEARLIDVVRSVWNVHNPNQQIAEGDFTIDFSDLVTNVSDGERLSNYQSRIDMGIWSPVDALMAENPDIRDRNEAIELLQERQQENDLLGSSFDINGMINDNN